MDPGEAKAQLRRRLLDARRRRPEAERRAAKDAVHRHLLDALGGDGVGDVRGGVGDDAACVGGGVAGVGDDVASGGVACVGGGVGDVGVGVGAVRVLAGYVPLATEPLDLRTLDELSAAGARVLVPIVAGAEPLDWCAYPCPVPLGPFGVAAPAGEPLGTAAALEADAILIPALAVDGAGRRLGRGGGHYDRTLTELARLAELAEPTELAPGTERVELAEPLSGREDPAPRRPRLIAVVFDDEVLDEVPTQGFDRPVDAVVTPSGGLRPTHG